MNFNISLILISGDFFQGVFGGLSENHPDLSDQPCTVDEDCTFDNEKCHDMKLCGTKECQSKSDCKEIGNLAEGKYLPLSCENGICKYELFAIMTSGASRSYL